MTKARDTANIVGGGFSGTIAGATMEPTGDTAAGDNAAIGFTAAEGLILTGQGSTGDVTIKNDADALVAHVPTGTTGITFAGTPTFPDGSIAVADLDIDGGTDIGAALVDADLMIVDDGAGGTNRKATMARLATYMGTKITGGSMVYLASSGVISDAASVVFTQFDATAYDHYQFMLQHVIPATDGVVLFAQSSTDGGYSYASTSGDYHTNTTNDMIGFTVAGHTTVSGETLLVGSDTDEHGVSGPFMLYAPHNTSAYTYANCGSITFNTNAGAGTVSSNGTSANSFAVASSVRLAAEDVDAIKFLFNSGNIESGEIVMYGIANGT
jgi:hypothetical protein